MTKKIISIIMVFFFMFMISPNYVHATDETETLETVSTEDDAILYLREQMVLRSSLVEFTYVDQKLTSADISRIYSTALEHTGVSYEGDYIYSHLFEYAYSLEYETLDDGYNTNVTFSFTWTSTYEQEQEVNEELKVVLDELDLYDKTDYEKVVGVYDFITDNVNYDFEGVEIENNHFIHTAYSALITKKTVCQGYATLLYRMLLELGVDTRYIVGDSDGERHSWNIVKVDDLYYNMDATFDRDLKGSYRYFLCTNYNFPLHTRDSAYSTTAFNEAYPMAQIPYRVVTEASGTVNSNIIWYLDEEGKLTIEGSGAIPNYSYSTIPWKNYANSINSIVVSEGITSIGNYNFCTLKLVTDVSLPSTLKSIGNYAFDNCRALQYLTLPEGLTTVGTNAFSECVALKEMIFPDTVVSIGTSVFSTCHNITYVKLPSGMTTIPDSMFFNMDRLSTVVIPDTVTTISQTAFCACDGLTQITLSKNVKTIGSSAFADCKNLRAINVDDENPYFSDINGVLYNKDQTTLICCPAGKNLTSFEVPSGVKKIDRSAFSSSKKLTSITLPDTLLSIEDYVFSECIALKTITIPASTYRIGDSCFRDCKSLTSITILNDNLNFDWYSFANCTSLKTITLPKNLTKIEVGLFSGCTALREVILPDNISIIDSSAFEGSGIYKLVIPSGVSVIDFCSFRNCDLLYFLVFEGDISYIDMYAFEGCPNLTMLYFKGNLGSYDASAFNGTNITSLYLGNQTLVKNIANGSHSSLMSNVQAVAFNDDVNLIYSYYTDKFSTSSKIELYDEELLHYTNHTCSWNGFLTGYQRCPTCYTVRDYHYHSYTIKVKNPTCTSMGYSTYTCECGHTYKTDYVASLGHNYLTTTYLPTCLEQGYTKHTCTRCGSYYKDSYTSALGHDIIIDAPVDATCTKTGLTDGYHCSRCSYKVAQKVVPALGHNYLKSIYLPTCTEQGYTVHTCDRCSDTYNDSYTSALGHDLVIDERVEPTCTTTGLTEGCHCSRCDYKEEQEVIPTISHVYEDGVCINCGKQKMPYQRLTYFTIDVESNGKSYSDNAVLYLPSNYTFDGEPVKLIIYCKQGSSAITSTTNPIESVGFYNYLLSLGYAILGVDGVSDDWVSEVGLDNTRVVGNPLAVQGTEIAYDYVIDNYNIDSTGCFISGYSQGGHYAQNVIDLTDIPILAAAEQSPVCSMRYHQWDLNATVKVGGVSYTKAARLNIARMYGFPAVATNNELLSLEYNETLVSLYDPWVRNSTDVYTNFVQSGNLWSLPDDVSLDDITMKKEVKCPVKIWCSEDDTALGVDVMKVFVKAIQNAGGDAEISVYSSGGHGFFTKLNTVGSFTENGKTYKTPLIGVEIAQWFEQYGGYSCEHNYSEEKVEPTCLTQGYTTFTCSTCGHSHVGNYVDALDHDLVTDERVEPTCTNTGLTEGCHCSRCDYVEEQEVIDAIGHDYKDTITAPTCTERGYTTHVCERCKDTYVDSYVVALGHDLITDERVEPTCTETGLTEGSHCSRCDHKVTQQIIPALGHDYKDTITAPTCTERGYTTHVCERCKDTYVDSYVDALGHDLIIDSKVDATCTETGLTEGSHCSRCDYKVEQVVIPALGHNHKETITAPTCTERGFTTHTCKRCSNTYVDTYVDALGHSYSEWEIIEEATEEKEGLKRKTCSLCGDAVEQAIPVLSHTHKYDSVVINPTCTNQGYTLHTCKCGESYKDTYIDALGHDLITDDKVDATCTTTGLTEGCHCSRCDYKVEQEVIPALGHDYKDTVTAPTCTEKGYTTHVCERCSDSYIDNYVDALGHDLVTDDKVDATCTTTGLTEGCHCSRCDYKVEQEVIPALGHDYKETITSPTCTERGYTTHTCERCKDSYVDSYVDALGHSYGEWEIIEEATEEKEGLKRKTCSLCDDVVEEVIPALTHTHKYESKVVEPTCLEKGYTLHSCKCGESYKDNYVDALGHDLIIDEKVDATCSTSGLTEGCHCSRCDYKVEQAIVEALGHDLIIIKGKEPTCTESGLSDKEECTKCDYVKEHEVLDPLGHDLIIDEKVDATCTETGLTEGCHCSRCDYVEAQVVIEALGHEESKWITDRFSTTTSTGLRHTECIHCGLRMKEEIIPITTDPVGGCNESNIALAMQISSLSLMLVLVLRKRQ